MRSCTYLLLLLATHASAAQWSRLDAAARGIAGAGTAHRQPGVRPVNPASLPDRTTVWFGQSMLYGGAGIRPGRAGVSLTRGADRLALDASVLRIDGWSDLRAAFSAARAGRSARIGFRIEGLRRRAGSLHARTSVRVRSGILLALSPRLDVAVLAGRAVAGSMAPDDSAVLRGGLAWRFPGFTDLLVDLVRTGAQAVAIMFGIEVHPQESIVLRAGTASPPDRLAVGLGLATGRLRVDLGLDRHPELGRSISLDVALRLLS